MAVKEVGCELINLAYNRGQWWAVVGRMSNVLILLNSRQLFYWLRVNGLVVWLLDCRKQVNVPMVCIVV